MGIVTTNIKIFESNSTIIIPHQHQEWTNSKPWQNSRQRQDNEELTNDELIDSLISLLDKPVIVNPQFSQEKRRHDDANHRECMDYNEMIDSLLSLLDAPVI